MCFMGCSKEFVHDSATTIHDTVQDINIYYKEPVRFISTNRYALYTIGQHIVDLSDDDIETAIEQAHGTFAYVLHMKLSGDLIIGTDKLGFFPLYYTNDPENGFIFTNLLPHLKHRLKKPQPNWEAWDDLLNGNDIIGDKTTIQGVKRLRHGQKIRYQNSEMRLETFWRYEGAEYVDAETYIKDNNDLLNDSLHILTKASSEITLPLTGGHDSRRLALMLAKSSNQQQISAITQETITIQQLDLDTPIASITAEKLGLKNHLKLSQPAAEVLRRNYIYKDYWCGFESQQHGWAINMATHLRNGPRQTIFDGIIGDITINDHFLHKDPRLLPLFREPRQMAALLQNKHSPHIFKREFLSTSLSERIEEEIETLPVDANRTTLFKVFNHTRRNIGCWYIPFLLQGHDIALAYGYAPLFDQSLALDPKFRATDYFQQRCMEAVAPEIAAIPSTRDQHPKAYWQSLGAKEIPIPPSYPINLQTFHDVFTYFDVPFIDRLKNTILLSLAPRYATARLAWRYEAFQRICIFLKWLQTDESDLPVLYTEDTPFLNTVFDTYSCI